MTTELILAGEKFADDRRWHVDTTLKILDLVCSVARVPGFSLLTGCRVRSRRFRGQHCEPVL
jgi:hypothetical protein